MIEIGNKKVYYISYFGDSDKGKYRVPAPAADAKVEYIAQVMSEEGYEVEVVSFREFDKRDNLLEVQGGYIKKLGRFKIHFFSSFSSKLRIIRLLGRLYTKWQGKKYINRILKENDIQIIIYHSLALMWIAELLKERGRSFIFEAEEVYSDVIEDEQLRKNEIRILEKADGYIFPTGLLSEVVNKLNKPEVIIHGTYRAEPISSNSIFNIDSSNEMVHCVYAGTLDPRKGGALAAINAARYLPSNYHMHILGFGSEKEIRDTILEIDRISNEKEATVSYDGVLYGEKYTSFLQSCQIGLSTQNPSGVYNSTSFPSKILSYMANGLKVVSVRIPAIETSAIGNSIFYYDRQDPKEIAHAIIEAGKCNLINPRMVINNLDHEFRKRIKQLVEMGEEHGKMES